MSIAPITLLTLEIAAGDPRPTAHVKDTSHPLAFIASACSPDLGAMVELRDLDLEALLLEQATNEGLGRRRVVTSGSRGDGPPVRGASGC
jgi:hypothetical protein